MSVLGGSNIWYAWAFWNGKTWRVGLNLAVIFLRTIWIEVKKRKTYAHGNFLCSFDSRKKACIKKFRLPWTLLISFSGLKLSYYTFRKVVRLWISDMSYITVCGNLGYKYPHSLFITIYGNVMYEILYILLHF